MTILRLSLSAKTLTFSAGAASRIFGSVRAVKRTFSRASLALETVGGDERSACGEVDGRENREIGSLSLLLLLRGWGEVRASRERTELPHENIPVVVEVRNDDTHQSSDVGL
jgi:hypothetical protein